jgi:hypothetical protein
MYIIFLFLHKLLDKEAKAKVDAAVAEAKESPEPRLEDLWTDIYYKGTEPPSMRGREREEVLVQIFFSPLMLYILKRRVFSGSSLLEFDCSLSSGVVV